MLKPGTEAELAEIVAGATEPLAVQGGGTKGMTPEGEPLTTAALSGISLYEPGALTIVAQAGTPVAEVEAALDAENQRLAFEPMDYRGLLQTTGEPTIGGVVAANVSGPRRISVGACRDFALGVRYVDGAGQIIKNGGRVMKNVTGYDLVKLMSGSRGTLGVLTEVSLKVLPKPETMATVMIVGQTPDEAVGAMSTALGSPYDVTGAAYSPCGLDGTPVTAIRLEGFEGSVRYRSDAIQALFSGLQTYVETDVDKVAAGWEMIRDCQTLKDEEGDVWRISVKPSDAPAVLKQVQPSQYLLDWGGGLIWAAVSKGDDLRARLGSFDGHATLVRSDSQTRAVLGMFQPEPAPVAAISAGLRARFDPRGMLNPGLMG